jgi:hypothetical protein
VWPVMRPIVRLGCARLDAIFAGNTRPAILSFVRGEAH